MKIFVITGSYDECFEVLATTTDEKLAARYCAIHPECSYTMTEDGKGLELTEEEKTMPLNTTLSVGWNYLKEDFISVGCELTTKGVMPYDAKPSIGLRACDAWIIGILEGERDISTKEKCEELARIELTDLIDSLREEYKGRHRAYRRRTAREYFEGRMPFFMRPHKSRILLGQAWCKERVEGAINHINTARYEFEKEFADELADISEEEVHVRFNMTGEVKKNFDFIKQNMKDYGYFYSGPRIAAIEMEDDVRLVFQKYGTENVDKNLIAFSYARLKEVSEAGTFQDWFARSLRELFKETEEE